jgi:hypothetical protein
MVMRSMAVNWHPVIGQSGDIGWQTECDLVRFVGAEVCDQYRRSAKVAERFDFEGERKRMFSVETVAHRTLKPLMALIRSRQTKRCQK